MKRLLLVLLCATPIMLTAQKKCVYFEKMVKLDTEKTNLNTSQSDFGPAFVENELWFSAFTSEEIEKLESGSNKKIYYNLYTVATDAKGNVEGTKSMKFAELSEGYHVGPVSYCEATGELFVTLSNFENPEIHNKVYQRADIRLKIIIAKQVGGTWQKVGELPYNDPSYSVGHPSVTSSGDTLFFVSNVPDKGFGGTDIYMGVRQNGQWGEMINLGDKINTPEDEMFPFIYRDKILIYSSKGLGEGDDLDIYAVGLMGDKIMEPSAIADLNSPDDDFGFVISSSNEVGYYCSNKSGGEGSDDIYKVIITPKGKYELELVVMNKKLNKPVSNPELLFDGENVEVRGGIFKRELEKDKTYLVKTNIDGYTNESTTISTVNKPFGVIRDTLWVDVVTVGMQFVMDNIYYDFDKWDILPESAIELDKLVDVLKENPGWKVELGSHTDSRGSDAYNMVLSQKRSDSAVGYIVSKGISKDRIIAKGYGETELVNKCDDGVPCSEADHRKNRRTEFKILEMN